MFLSGGIDSGLVASYATELGAKDLLCFVVEVADRTLNEAPAARRIAGRLGLPIETIPLEIAPLDAIETISLLYGQPFGDSSAVPTYFVARAASAHRKVVLNGDGGDEIFAGYRRYWAGLAARSLAPVPALLKRPSTMIAAALAHIAERRSRLGYVGQRGGRSEEHTSELQSRQYLVCRLLLEKKNNISKPDLQSSSHRIAWRPRGPPAPCGRGRAMQRTPQP